MDWKYGSSGRVPGLQVWSPEFKLQSREREGRGERERQRERQRQRGRQRDRELIDSSKLTLINAESGASH
jgi:hypothetical protein